MRHRTRLRFSRDQRAYVAGPYRVEIEVDGSQYRRVWAVRCLGRVIGRAPDCTRAKQLAQEHAVATGYVPVPVIGAETDARLGVTAGSRLTPHRRDAGRQ